MRQIDVPTRTIEDPFDYYCPTCGIELPRSSHEAFDKSYFCPFCSSQERPSRAPRSRW